ncbi:MAG: DUF4445 domain-containing protein [Firmicutes bacterium]|nr:DUF4445 domain-containing protein [Bacillota bacterium]
MTWTVSFEYEQAGALQQADAVGTPAAATGALAEGRLQEVLPGKSLEASPTETLLETAQRGGVEIESACGGKSRCGQCRVSVSGPLSPPTVTELRVLSETEIERGVRLACQARPMGEVTVKIPWSRRRGRHQILTSGSERPVRLAPTVRKLAFQVPQPSLLDLRGDFERIRGEMTAQGVHRLSPAWGVLGNLALRLREADFAVTAAVEGDLLISVEPGNTADRLFGIAVDIGTTSVVVGLVDLLTAREPAVAARLNAQVAFGSDVVSRIGFAAGSPEALDTLRGKVVETINDCISELCGRTAVESIEIYAATVVGNTCMSHLFCGVSPAYLAQSPYVPAIQGALTFSGREAGLSIHPCARVHVLPNIAGFVGADTVGVILATAIDHASTPKLAIDIGTNGEMVCGTRERLVACSTAAGPAFEGAQIRWGMRAATGAIEAVEIGDDVSIHTIEEAKPRGICGSGLIDAVAQLLQQGIIDEYGRILDREELDGSVNPKVAKRVIPGDSGNEFVLAWAEDSEQGAAITLSQRDVRQLQLGKGAISAGTKTLLAVLGIEAGMLSEVLLAGAFGSYIKKESAMAIGLLPPVDLNRVRAVGNAARIGAKLALISEDVRKEGLAAARDVEYVELAGRPDFQEAFMDAMTFPAPARSHHN